MSFGKYLRLIVNKTANLSILSEQKPILKPKQTLNQLILTRTGTNFFNKLPAEHIWKGVTSVSNAGKKRGRGRGQNRRVAKDLNRGQIIGVGKANILWPGLSAPVIRGREIVKQQKLPEDPEREAKLIKLRDSMGGLRRYKLSPIERGWTGHKLPGRSIGPPDPIGEDNFEGFDTKVLEMKTVCNMTGNLGRKRRISVFVVTGNKNGLAGFGLGKALEAKGAIRKAKNRSGQKLMYIETYNNHTVYHDFFTQFGKTKIYVSKKPEGYGLVCHRAIKTICEVIGIKDLYAKLEGSNNLQHIVKAFFLGLLKQKTHQQLADEKQLYLVEFKKENGYFPQVVATPSSGYIRTENEIPKNEILDFNHYCLDGRIILNKKKWPPFYVGTHGHDIFLKKNEYNRNKPNVRLQLRAEYGEIRSFLTDKYPECKPAKWVKVKETVDEETNAE